MIISFVDYKTKETIFKKQLIEWCFLPRTGEGLALTDGRLARVMDVVYEINKDKNSIDFYGDVTLIVEVFEKEKN